MNFFENAVKLLSFLCLNKCNFINLNSGFPRTVVQAEELQNHHALDLVLNLDVPFATIRERLEVSKLLNSLLIGELFTK